MYFGKLVRLQSTGVGDETLFQEKGRKPRGPKPKGAVRFAGPGMVAAAAASRVPQLVDGGRCWQGQLLAPTAGAGAPPSSPLMGVLVFVDLPFSKAISCEAHSRLRLDLEPRGSICFAPKTTKAARLRSGWDRSRLQLEAI